MKYEYRMIIIQTYDDEHQLKEISNEGWNVISWVPNYNHIWDKNPSNYTLCMKRPRYRLFRRLFKNLL